MQGVQRAHEARAAGRAQDSRMLSDLASNVQRGVEGYQQQQNFERTQGERERAQGVQEARQQEQMSEAARAQRAQEGAAERRQSEAERATRESERMRQESLNLQAARAGMQPQQPPQPQPQPQPQQVEGAGAQPTSAAQPGMTDEMGQPISPANDRLAALTAEMDAAANQRRQEQMGRPMEFQGAGAARTFAPVGEDPSGPGSPAYRSQTERIRAEAERRKAEAYSRSVAASQRGLRAHAQGNQEAIEKARKDFLDADFGYRHTSRMLNSAMRGMAGQQEVNPADWRDIEALVGDNTQNAALQQEIANREPGPALRTALEAKLHLELFKYMASHAGNGEFPDDAKDRKWINEASQPFQDYTSWCAQLRPMFRGSGVAALVGLQDPTDANRMVSQLAASCVASGMAPPADFGAGLDENAAMPATQAPPEQQEPTDGVEQPPAEPGPAAGTNPRPGAAGNLGRRGPYFFGPGRAR